MSNERIIFPDFRDEQSDSRYPFADGASLQSSDGRVRIGNDMFLDASVYPIGNTTRGHVRRIVVSERRVTVEIGDDNRVALASVSFDPLADDNFTLRLVDNYGRDAGLLVSEPERLRVFAAWPVGEHLFPIGNAELVPSCYIPTPEIGVRGFLTAEGELLANDILIVGDNGIVVREEDGAIRIDAVGDPLFLRRTCAPAGRFVTPQFLQTINQQGPDDYGNFDIAVGDAEASRTVLRLHPTGQGALRLEVIGRKANT